MYQILNNWNLDPMLERMLSSNRKSLVSLSVFKTQNLVAHNMRQTRLMLSQHDSNKNSDFFINFQASLL